MEFETISVRMLDAYVNNPDAVIVDLRDSSEYKRLHILNSINIEFEYLQSHYDQLDRLNILNKKKMIVLYCERGANSMIAAKLLSGIGYMTKSVICGINMYRGRNLVKNRSF